MTVEECYAQLKGNYADAKSRMITDARIEKYMMRFPQDPTMAELKSALAAEDYETAFRGAHTLKGVAGTLAFSALQTSASALTEQLRFDKKAPDPALVQQVEEDYSLVINTLKDYKDGQL